MRLVNFRIGIRLWLCFGLVLVLLSGIVLLSAIGMARHATQTENLALLETSNVKNAELVLDAVNAHMLLLLDPATAADKVAISKLRITLEADARRLTEYLSTKDTAAVDQVAKVRESSIKYAVAMDSALGVLDGAKLDEPGKSSISEAIAAQRRLATDMAELRAARQKALQTSQLNLQQAYRSWLGWLIAIGIVAVGIGIVCAWRVIRSIVAPLNEAVLVAKQITSGDLTTVVEVNATGEIGELLQALKGMSESMFKIVSEVRMGTTAIASASGQLTSDNTALSFRTESQASSLEQTAASMEGLTLTVKQNAENAKQANQLVVSASDFAVKGGQVVGHVVKTMGSIKDSSHKIADIIGVIDGIAFQTNILALNAAVEAAHAGEQGRGFAAVASEVRNLAQNSAQAAKEVKQLIDDSVEKVDAGSKLVDEAGKSMSEIVTSFQHVADIMSEISAASQEQRTGIEEVNQAIMQIDEMTQKNAELVEEASRSGTSLHEQAVTLSRTVSRFNLGAMEHGNADQAIDMVKRAAEFARANGTAALIDEVNRLNKGQFIDRDLYLSIYSMEDALVVAHGSNARVVGMEANKVKDVDGKYFTKDMLHQARTKGEGWVDYKWAHPLTKEIKLKSSYFERVSDVFVACGYYKE